MEMRRYTQHSYAGGDYNQRLYEKQMQFCHEFINFKNHCPHNVCKVLAMDYIGLQCHGGKCWDPDNGEQVIYYGRLCDKEFYVWIAGSVFMGGIINARMIVTVDDEEIINVEGFEAMRKFTSNQIAHMIEGYVAMLHGLIPDPEKTKLAPKRKECRSSNKRNITSDSPYGREKVRSKDGQLKVSRLQKPVVYRSTKNLRNKR